MPNLSYNRGRSREYKTVKAFEEDGYPLVVRTAGSHSPVDVIAIKEMALVPEYGLCFIGKLIQLKTSTKFKTVKKTNEVLETENGAIMYERWEYPVNDKRIKHNTKSKKRVGVVKLPAGKVKAVPARRSDSRPKKQVK